MKNSDLKAKFINLRLNSVSQNKIVDVLGISKSTAVRWNKSFSETIQNFKTQQEQIVNSEIVKKVDHYLDSFESYFKVIDNELKYYKKFPMAFDVALDNSFKTFNIIEKLISMKKIYSNVIPNEELKNAILDDIDDNIPETNPEINSIIDLDADSTSYPKVDSNINDTDKNKINKIDKDNIKVFEKDSNPNDKNENNINENEINKNDTNEIYNNENVTNENNTNENDTTQNDTSENFYTNEKTTT